MFSACRFARPVRNPGLKFSGGKQKRTKKMEYLMINLSAIEHRAFDNFCYPLDETNLIVNLKTGKEVEKVFILWGDPFDWGKENDASNYHWQFTTVEVTGKKELQNHLWWSITLQPKFKRCKYLFKIQQGDESYIFGESGLVSEKEFLADMDSYYPFIFPWMNRNDISNPPEWAENTVWYQIFPSRFCRGKSNHESEDFKKQIQPWAGADDEVNNSMKFGGNLNGITEKLGYLEDLGITGIYLNPVNCSTTQHKYDTTDYFDIDPEFGTREDMKNLVKEAHKHGIRIMLDGVFNHSGWEFFAWQDVLKNREKSKYASWYMVNDWNFDGKPGLNASEAKFYAFAYCDYMPKFNTNNPEVRKYLIDACEYWVTEYGIDALRLDVANEVCHDFCRELQERMRGLKSDFYIIGEIWHNSTPWLRGNEFDAIMNYPLQNAIYKFALGKDEDTRNFEQDVNRCLTDYFIQTEKVMFNLMDSHDTMRLVTKAGSREKAVQMLSVMFAMPGSPCLYYGTEVFLEGGKDPDCRRCMPWDGIESGKYACDIDTVKKLVSLRKNNPALGSYDVRFLHSDASGISDSRVLCIEKTASDGKKKILLISNFSDDDCDISSLAAKKDLLFENLLEISAEGSKKILRKGGVAIFGIS